MSASTLTASGSPDVGTTPLVEHPPPNLSLWLTNTLICNRWNILFLSNLINAVPPSQTRLRSQGLVPFYNHIVDLVKALESIAREKQITLPLYPDASVDWKQELATDQEKLYTELAPLVEPQMKESIDFLKNILSKEGGYHWGSMVAAISVSSDAYLDPPPMTKSMQEGMQKVLANKTLAPFILVIMDERMKESAKVLKEEIEKCRGEPGETGWKEEEAKELSTEQLRLSKQIYAIGMEYMLTEGGDW